MQTRAFPVGVFAGLCLMVQMVAADAISLYPSKDNTLIEYPAGNSNGQGDIFAGATKNSGSRRGLIHFEIAGNIAAGSTITNVTLTLRYVKGQNVDQWVSLHRVFQDWGEGASSGGGGGSAAEENDATWLYTFHNAANPDASPTWTSPGGDFRAAVSGSTLVTGDGIEGQWFSWSGPQMVADVQNWLDDPDGNFGWALLGNEEQMSTAKRLNSRESAAKPALLVDYNPVPEPGTIVLLATGSAALMLVIRRGRKRRRCLG